MSAKVKRVEKVVRVLDMAKLMRRGKASFVVSSG